MNFLTDVPVHFINTVQRPWSDIIIFCATTLGIVMIISALIFLIFRKLPYEHAFSTFEHMIKKAGDIFILFITSFGAYFFSVVLKSIFMVGRPVAYTFDLHPILSLTGYGFPSSHASFYSAIAVTLFFMSKEAGYVAIFTAILIGTGRVLAGVHSPLDILGGFLLGLLISSVVDFVVEKVSDWKKP